MGKNCSRDKNMGRGVGGGLYYSPTTHNKIKSSISSLDPFIFKDKFTLYYQKTIVALF